MTITGRTLALAVAASSVLGGSIGALAAAATSSQASPAAVAAVERVKDSAAEADLAAIGSDLEAIKTDLKAPGGEYDTAYRLLVKICENTIPAGSFVSASACTD